MPSRTGSWLLWFGLVAVGCNNPPAQPRSTPRTPASTQDAGFGPLDANPIAQDVPPPNLPPPTPPDGGDPGIQCHAQGPENTEAACGNGADDDCDGQIDCADNDCASTAHCTGDGGRATSSAANCTLRGPENTAAACDNHTDDDCDGHTDCADNDCRLRPNSTCGDAGGVPPINCTPRGPENTAAACSDRIDNDCDNQVDCADNDCPAERCPRRPRPPVVVPPAAAPARPAAPGRPAAPARPAARPAAPARR